MENKTNELKAAVARLMYSDNRDIRDYNLLIDFIESNEKETYKEDKLTPEKRESAIKWLEWEIRSLKRAPEINGCGPEPWAEQLEIMETCMEAVKAYPTAHIGREKMTNSDRVRSMIDEKMEEFLNRVYSAGTNDGDKRDGFLGDANWLRQQEEEDCS